MKHEQVADKLRKSGVTVIMRAYDGVIRPKPK
jgi:hypothetical protein